jgi:hypothetical protein
MLNTREHRKYVLLGELLRLRDRGFVLLGELKKPVMNSSSFRSTVQNYAKQGLVEIQEEGEILRGRACRRFLVRITVEGVGVLLRMRAEHGLEE